ncbi:MULTISPECIES: hypothetical protein [Bacillus]|uniref:hypothetical protein n=1 Tax=Bacillus TaxID=1386 RepID=UPI0011AAFDB9|nr:hypothetical protein [Bacillus licheniformis]TWL14632.1 hypothetical protein CHCC16874_1676 [Bacillus licheniformis]
MELINEIPNAYIDIPAKIFKQDNEIIIKVNNGAFYMADKDIDSLDENVLYQLGEHCLYDDPSEEQHYTVKIQSNGNLSIEER